MKRAGYLHDSNQITNVLPLTSVDWSSNELQRKLDYVQSYSSIGSHYSILSIAHTSKPVG